MYYRIDGARFYLSFEQLSQFLVDNGLPGGLQYYTLVRSMKDLSKLEVKNLAKEVGLGDNIQNGRFYCTPIGYFKSYEEYLTQAMKLDGFGYVVQDEIDNEGETVRFLDVPVIGRCIFPKWATAQDYGDWRQSALAFLERQDLPVPFEIPRKFIQVPQGMLVYAWPDENHFAPDSRHRAQYPTDEMQEEFRKSCEEFKYPCILTEGEFHMLPRESFSYVPC